MSKAIGVRPLLRDQLQCNHWVEVDHCAADQVGLSNTRGNLSTQHSTAESMLVQNISAAERTHRHPIVDFGDGANHDIRISNLARVRDHVDRQRGPTDPQRYVVGSLILQKCPRQFPSVSIRRPILAHQLLDRNRQTIGQGSNGLQAEIGIYPGAGSQPSAGSLIQADVFDLIGVGLGQRRGTKAAKGHRYRFGTDRR